jgi:hypothetical protein
MTSNVVLCAIGYAAFSNSPWPHLTSPLKLVLTGVLAARKMIQGSRQANKRDSLIGDARVQAEPYRMFHRDDYVLVAPLSLDRVSVTDLSDYNDVSV